MRLSTNGWSSKMPIFENEPLTEDDVNEALAEAANTRGVSTAYPWPPTIDAVLQRVASQGYVTTFDEDEAYRHLDESNVEADILDAESNV